MSGGGGRGRRRRLERLGQLLVLKLRLLFENLPEAGEVELPKLVFFFDEAHLLFDQAPKTLLEKRLLILRKDVLDPLLSLLDQGKPDEKENYDKEEFERIKDNFFNVVIYAVYELNFFGLAPIYIVGPNVKYLIDERVLPYVGRP